MFEQIPTEVQTILVAAIVGILGYGARIAGKLAKRLEDKVDAWLDAKLSSDQREIAHKIGKEAFAFAETTFKEADGAEKLDRARSYLLNSLNANGIKLSESEMKAVIEKAVLEFNKGRISSSELAPIEVNLAGSNGDI